MGEQKYFYVIVEKRNGKMFIEDSKLPIYWLRSMAKKRVLDFEKTKLEVRRLNASDINNLILNSPLA